MKIGPFVALALGALLFATTGLVLTAAITGGQAAPGRYAAAPAVVVTAADLAEPGHVDYAGGVPDRTFYAQLEDGPAEQIGRPWSAAAFSGYRLTAGRAPRDGEIVVPGGTPGRRVGVRTAAGTRAYTVSGATGQAEFESAVFFSDAEAARLAPRADAVILTEPPRTVPAGLRVLTGDDRALADPRARRDAAALAGLTTVMGLATAVAAFVSVFVVAATFAFSVTQRRRELALLRLAGATPAQVTRTVLGEAARTGVAAAAAGCALALLAAPALARLLAAAGAAPEWFTVAPSLAAPLVLLVAFGAGVALAIGGSGAAAVRAGRIRPIEALRDAEADERAMTPFRWAGGVAALAVAAGALALTFALPGPYGAELARYTGPALIVALALLSPPVIRPLTRVLVPGGLLVRANTLASVRRAAAVTAPVLLTVGLMSTLWGTAEAAGAAASRAERHEYAAATSVVLPKGAPGLNREVTGRLADLDALTVATTTLYAVPEAGVLYGPSPQPIPFDARAVNRADLLTLPVLAGRPADLDDSSIVVDETLGRAVGDEVRVLLADGRPVTLRVVAVTGLGGSGGGAVVTARHAGTALPAAAYVRGDLPAGLLHDLPVTVLPFAQWSAAGEAGRAQQARLALLAVGGVAVLYTGVAVANTLVMSTRRRSRELALLRAAGATPGQVLRMVAAEAALVVTIGALLAGVVTAVTSGGLWLALNRVAEGTPWSFPLAPFLAGTAACLVTALLSAVLPAAGAARSLPSACPSARP
ncbi:ABC transporter permease [Nonomuraea typhae]|uniref:ABC transporter permease n=1 Tax=Nonomuraea typhae TaxID=2603600 RepID=UPI0012F7B7CB|nr:ABC transporter permease [Nonomuraea typhae]